MTETKDNILTLQEAIEKQKLLYNTTTNENAIKDGYTVMSRGFLDVLKEFDEATMKLNNVSPDDKEAYSYYRAFMSVIDSEFISFARQIIGTWADHCQRITEARSDARTTIDQLVTLAKRHNNIDAKNDTFPATLAFTRWIKKEIRVLLNKSRKKALIESNNASIEFTCKIILQMLLRTPKVKDKLAKTKTLYIQRSGERTSVHARLSRSKSIKLMDIVHIESNSLIKFINSRLTYILRDTICPECNIISGQNKRHPMIVHAKSKSNANNK